MRAVISVGGSVTAHALTERRDAYLGVFQDLVAATDTLVIVTGAGPLKEYQRALPDTNEARRDLVGMHATRLHAAALAAALDANSRIPTNLEDVHELAQVHDVVVTGGLLPGQSTDAVAAEAAEILDADRLVLATTVDGVYDADPDTDPDATRHDEMTYDALLDLVRDYDARAGTYPLMDVTCATLTRRSGLETVVLDGEDLDSLAKALDREPPGTVIRS